MPFEPDALALERPRSLKQALAMLADDASLTPIAGCTDVFVALHFGSQWNAESVEPYLQLGSAVCILALAAWMFLRTRRELAEAHAHHHSHSHDDERDHGERRKEGSKECAAAASRCGPERRQQRDREERVEREASARHVGDPGQAVDERPGQPDDAVAVDALVQQREVAPHGVHVDKDGNVFEAAVDETRELVDMMETARTYQNNVEVVNTARELMMRTLDIIKN